MTAQMTGYDMRISQIMKKTGQKLEPETLFNVLIKLCKKFVFQLEEGKQIKEYEGNDNGTGHGYLHYQCRFQLMKKSIRATLLKQLHELFEKYELGIFSEWGYYLSPTVKGIHTTSNFNYVLKHDTKIGDHYTETSFIQEELKEPLFIPYHLIGLIDKLKPFQKSIRDSAKPENRNPRTIDCIIDTKGNIGKSTICDLMNIYEKAIILPTLSDHEKIISSVCNMCSDTNNRDPKIIFMDLPRAINKNKQLMSSLYTALEVIKSGRLEDPRNHYKQYRIHPPRVWTFSNTIPDLRLLSIDRWQFYEVKNDELIKLDMCHCSKIDREHLRKECDEIKEDDEEEIITTKTVSFDNNISIKKNINEEEEKSTPKYKTRNNYTHTYNYTPYKNNNKYYKNNTQYEYYYED